MQDTGIPSSVYTSLCEDFQSKKPKCPGQNSTEGCHIVCTMSLPPLLYQPLSYWSLTFWGNVKPAYTKLIQHGTRSACSNYIHYCYYRLGTVNSNKVNSKLPLYSKFSKVLFATYLSFHAKYLLLIRIPLNSKPKLANDMTSN